MRRFSSRLWCILVVGVTACSVEIDLEGRPCPCGPGWTCDEELGLCVTGEVQQCGLDEALERSAVEIQELRVGWRTDEALELRWTIDEAGWELVDHFDLVIGTDEEAVRTRGEGVTIFDASSVEHPELQRSELPYTGGGDEVDRIVLRGLEPDRTYLIRLTLYDTTGAVSCPPMIEALTWVSTDNRIVMFDENTFDDPLPLCIERVNDAALASTGSLFARYTARCEQIDSTHDQPVCEEPVTASESCWENVRLRGLDLQELDVDVGQFDAVAHLRVDVAMDETGHGFWSEIALNTPVPSPFEDPDALPGEHYLFVVKRRTFVADGTYRTYTAPLAQMELRCSDEQRDADNLNVILGGEPQCDRFMTAQDAQRGFNTVRVGARFNHLGAIRIDNATLNF